MILLTWSSDDIRAAITYAAAYLNHTIVSDEEFMKKLPFTKDSPPADEPPATRQTGRLSITIDQSPTDRIVFES